MKNWMIISAFLGFSSVVFAALGAHLVPSEQLNNFQVANQMEFFHSIVILALSLYASNKQSNLFLKLALYLFFLGIALFSFGIYVNILTPFKDYLFIVPFGGSALMLGWLSLVAYGIRS